MEVRIRPLEENDAKTSYIWRNDPEIWRYTGSSPDQVITLEDELVWIRRVIKDNTSRRFAIIADNKYVGNVYLTDIHDKQAEYHIFIGNKEYMGKGIAKWASKQIISYARNGLNLKLINLEVNPENTRAIQLYISLGFKIVRGDETPLNMTIDL